MNKQSEIDLISSVRLSELHLPHEYQVIINILMRSLGGEVTVADFLCLSEENILKVPSMGVKRLQKVRALKEQFQKGGCFPALIVTNDEVIENHLSDAELDTELESLVLSREMIVPLRSVINYFNGHGTVRNFLDLRKEDLRLIPKLGLKKIETLHKLKTGLMNGSIAGFSQDEMVEEFNNVESFEEIISLEEMELKLLEAFDLFISNLSESYRYIFTSRHGIDCKQLTLEEVGQNYLEGKLTRERIRQIQVRLDENWSASISRWSMSLWYIMQDNLSLLRGSIFPKWAKHFSKNLIFYDFLAISSGQSPKALRALLVPDYSSKLLDDFWSQHRSPAAIDDVADFIIDRKGWDNAVAENAIKRMCDDERCFMVKDGLVPLNLSKSVALAHTALLFPMGAPLKKLQNKGNSLNFSRSPFEIDRLDGSIGRAVDAGLVYQSARGSYRHLSYLSLSADEIDSVLELLKKALTDASCDEVTAIHLMTGFYQKATIELDYFIVRHVVKTFGEKYGIFFKGKSGTDTVSLEKNFSSMSQKVAILEHIKQNKGPVTKEQIASIIRSKSVSHANFYIDQLRDDKVIVYVGESEYDIPDKAFVDVDIEKVVLAAAEIIEPEKRVIETNLLCKRLNRKLELKYNRYFYASLLEYFGSEYGFTWYSSYSLISSQPLPFKSITDAVRIYLEDNPLLVRDEENYMPQVMDYLDDVVHIEPKTAHNVAYQLLQKYRLLIHNESKESEITVNSENTQNNRKEYLVKDTLELKQKRILKEIFTYLTDFFTKQEASLWILRLSVIRYMEVNDYLAHGRKLLLQGNLSQGNGVMDHPREVIDSLGLNLEKVDDLILQGNQEALYRYVFIATCVQLHKVYPQLFPSSSEDNIYQLLPDFLFRTDSFIRKFSNAIGDEYWFELTIFDEFHRILSQYIGINSNSLVPRVLVGNNSEDISHYKISEQVNINEPESFQVLDADCGSGMFMTEYFQSLAKAYRAGGFRPREFVSLILKNNLLGLANDVFSMNTCSVMLVMFACKLDRRFAERGVHPMIYQFDNTQVISALSVINGRKFDRIFVNMTNPQSYCSCGSWLQPNESKLISLWKYHIKPTGVIDFLYEEKVLWEKKYTVLRQYLLDKGELYSVCHFESESITAKEGRCIFSIGEIKEHNEVPITVVSGKKTDTSNATITFYKLNIADVKTAAGAPLAYWIPHQYWSAFSRYQSMSNMVKLKRIGKNNTNRLTRFWWEVTPVLNGKIQTNSQWLDFVEEKLIQPWLFDPLKQTKSNNAELLPSDTLYIASTESISAVIVPEGTLVNRKSGLKANVDDSKKYRAMTTLNSNSWNNLLDIYRTNRQSHIVDDSYLESSPFLMPENTDLKQFIIELLGLLQKGYVIQESSKQYQNDWFLLNKSSTLSQLAEQWVSQELKRCERINELTEKLNVIVEENLGVGKILKYNKVSTQNYKSAVNFIQGVISHAIGSLLGRYKNEKRLKSVNYYLPLTHSCWFPDDGVTQLECWIRDIFGLDNYEENLNYIGDHLDLNDAQVADKSAVLRDYLISGFYDEHKRSFHGIPIYLMLCSGKYKAFQCLIYIHQFNNATLASIRVNHVVPLIQKFKNHEEQLAVRIIEASTMSQNIKLNEELKNVQFMRVELSEFDERIRYFTEKKIKIDPELGILQIRQKLNDLICE